MLERLPVIIKTLSPVVLADLSGDSVMTGTLDFIPGSVLRGVLAKQYMELKSLGAAAQADPGFFDLFLSGKLGFGMGYFWQSGCQALPLPFTLQTDKDKKNLQDTISGKFEAGYKQLKGYGYVDSQGLLHQAFVRKSIGMHISRQSDEERIVGSSKDGQIYNYKALEPGQTFLAYVVGERQDLQKLQKAFPELLQAYLGRSKHTQYGKCQVKLGGPEEVSTTTVTGKSLWVHFTTDYLPQDGCFASAKEALRPLLTELGAKQFDVQIGKIFSAVSSQEGFVGVWGVKRELRRSLAAGTVVELTKTEPWTEQEVAVVQQLGLSGVGIRRLDGFGSFQVYVCAEGLAQTKDEHVVDRPDRYNSEVKKVVEKVLNNAITEHLQLLAMEDIRRRMNDEKKRRSKHTFARLESYMISSASGVKVRDVLFAEDGEIRPYSRMMRNLQSLGNLQDVLSGERPVIYKTHWDEVVTGDMRNLANEVGCKLPGADDEEIYKTFWLWYCRMARKVGSKNKEGGEN